MDPLAAAPPRPRMSFATVLGFVGLAAIAVGWFLPWLTLTDKVASTIHVTEADLERMDRDAKAEGMDEGTRKALKNLASRQAVNGFDWASIGGWILDSEKHRPADPEGVRGLRLGVLVMRYGAWVVAALAAWLLVGGLRKPSFLAVALVLTFGLLLGAVAGLLWIGASENARKTVGEDPTVLGIGIYAITFGGILATVGGLFAVRTSTWWKAYLLTILLVVGAVMGCYQYVAGS